VDNWGDLQDRITSESPTASRPRLCCTYGVEACVQPRLTCLWDQVHLKNRKFLSPGDSGSVVLLKEPGEKAVVVGLGYAANRVTMVSYVMPIDFVQKDIEHVTGCRMTEPVYGGECLGDMPYSP
jgi:hypothetical protein